MTITHAINKHAPLVKLTPSQRKLKLKPWITSGIFKSIKTKQSLYKTHFINGNDSHKQFYKKYSNKLTKIKFLAKQQYFKFEFEQSKSNCYRSWRLIESLISSCKKSSALKCWDLNMTDPTSMADIFNDYFCNVGKTLAEKIPDCNSVNKFNKRASSCLFLSPTIPTEIFHQINSLKNSKSCGHDEISSYFLKVAAALLSYFFNSCFTQGVFPDCLKIAKVIPVFKSGSKTDTTNYRPISILSPFSKIFEKLIHSRTTAFLEKHSSKTSPLSFIFIYLFIFLFFFFFLLFLILQQIL